MFTLNDSIAFVESKPLPWTENCLDLATALPFTEFCAGLTSLRRTSLKRTLPAAPARIRIFVSLPSLGEVRWLSTSPVSDAIRTRVHGLEISPPSWLQSCGGAELSGSR